MSKQFTDGVWQRSPSSSAASGWRSTRSCETAICWHPAEVVVSESQMMSPAAMMTGSGLDGVVVGVGVAVAVRVAVTVAVRVDVGVDVRVAVGLGVRVDVAVRVEVGVDVEEGVLVMAAVGV